MIYDYDKSNINGVFILKPKVFIDNRGSITKTFHKESFLELGLDCDFGESLITENFQQGIIRGFHYQKPPFAQSKTIYCVSGKILDIVLDIRKNSPTYGETQTFDISNTNHNILYVPIGMANCYIIEEENTIISYNLTSQYTPSHESGIRWDSIKMDLHLEKPIMSEKDANLQNWDEFISEF